MAVEASSLTIATWFSRDLVRPALALVEAGAVTLRTVEAAKIVATVRTNGVAPQVSIEWGGGTGPQGLRAVCACGGAGVCCARDRGPRSGPHARRLRAGRRRNGSRGRARLASHRLGCAGSQSPQRVARVFFPKARRWFARSSSTRPACAGSCASRMRLRRCSNRRRRTIGTRATAGSYETSALGRSLRVAGDAAGARASDVPAERAPPVALRRPAGSIASSLGVANLSIDPRGVHLIATLRGGDVIHTFESYDGRMIDLAGSSILDGPPAWISDAQGAYLLGAAFDAGKASAAIAAARNVPGGSGRATVDSRPSLAWQPQPQAMARPSGSRTRVKPPRVSRLRGAKAPWRCA